MKCWLKNLLLVLILPLIVIGCSSGIDNTAPSSEQQINKDLEDYLRKMESWHARWDEQYWRDNYDLVAFDNLIQELEELNPPLAIWGMEYNTWRKLEKLESDYEEYVTSHKLWLATKKYEGETELAYRRVIGFLGLIPDIVWSSSKALEKQDLKPWVDEELLESLEIGDESDEEVIVNKAEDKFLEARYTNSLATSLLIKNRVFWEITYFSRSDDE